MIPLVINLPDQCPELDELYLVSLCIYREARGESYTAKLAVAWVIKNRVSRPSWWGKTWFEVVTKPYQFSSFNLGEANSIVFPPPQDPAWKESVQAAVDTLDGLSSDPTGGATFYYDRSRDKNPPNWAAQYKKTVDIGNFHFYVSA